LIILGIDPGSIACGYGIVQVNKRKIIAAGCDTIKLSANASLSLRLTTLYQEINKVITQYQPSMAAVESIFHGKNIKSAFVLGHARGVLMLALAEHDIPIYEYAPREIKRSVVGNGNASKEQIRYMVQQILSIDLAAASHDATDALAVALCHFNKNRWNIQEV
jgi:crossover junction endodeoxyribonuclease RuvC